MSKYFHEVRTEVVREGSPVLVESGNDIAPGAYNFRSTFDYPEETAAFIRANDNTRDLTGLPISTDTILIDIDEEEFVVEARDILFAQGVAVEEYKTGNRGCHFHVPLRTRITGVDVLYTVKAWLKDIGLWSYLDDSVYREGGQFRLESATHGKTGKSKVLVDDIDGPRLELDLRKTPPKVVHAAEVDVNGDVRNFFLNLLAKRDVGHRHQHCFILWTTGLQAGFDAETVRESILTWNSNQDTPHTDAMMTKKLEGFR